MRLNREAGERPERFRNSDEGANRHQPISIYDDKGGGNEKQTIRKIRGRCSHFFKPVFYEPPGG